MIRIPRFASILAALSAGILGGCESIEEANVLGLDMSLGRWTIVAVLLAIVAGLIATVAFGVHEATRNEALAAGKKPIAGPEFRVLVGAGMVVALAVVGLVIIGVTYFWRLADPMSPQQAAAEASTQPAGEWDVQLEAAHQWIANHRGQIEPAADSPAKERFLEAFVAANMYTGVWYHKQRAAEHPRCSSLVNNGDCWAYGFSLGWAVDVSYCHSAEGQRDRPCDAGHPVFRPPAECYGLTDFAEYVSRCEIPYLAE